MPSPVLCFSARSERKKLSNILSRIFSTMPIPLSITEKMASSSFSSIVNVTRPPSFVYLNAFETKFEIIISSFSVSNSNSMSDLSHTKLNDIFFCSQRLVKSSIKFSQNATTFIRCKASFSLSESTLRKSIIRLINLFNLAELLYIAYKYDDGTLTIDFFISKSSSI